MAVSIEGINSPRQLSVRRYVSDTEYNEGEEVVYAVISNPNNGEEFLNINVPLAALREALGI
jgi:hypothetical protein